MPNDAKLGLVVGVGLVIAVAVIFFRKESPQESPTDAVAGAPEEAVPRGLSRPLKARSAGRNAAEAVEEGPSARRHTVQEGETLYGLAQRYYGDGDKFAELFRHNKDVLTTPDRLPPGTVLVIPELPGR